jgi:hypothetical protein
MVDAQMTVNKNDAFVGSADQLMRGVLRWLSGFIPGLTLTIPAFGLDTFSQEIQTKQHCPADFSSLSLTICQDGAA